MSDRSWYKEQKNHPTELSQPQNQWEIIIDVVNLENVGTIIEYKKLKQKYALNHKENLLKFSKI